MRWGAGSKGFVWWQWRIMGHWMRIWLFLLQKPLGSRHLQPNTTKYVKKIPIYARATQRARRWMEVRHHWQSREQKGIGHAPSRHLFWQHIWDSEQFWSSNPVFGFIPVFQVESACSLGIAITYLNNRVLLLPWDHHQSTGTQNAHQQNSCSIQDRKVLFLILTV